MTNGIKYFLDKNKKSAQDFANEIGVSITSVNFWLAQKHQPTDKRRQQIAEYFSVETSEVFFV